MAFPNLTDQGGLTKLEQAALHKGMASARMVAFKLQAPITSVHRHVRVGNFEAKLIGRQRMITLRSVRKYLGPEAIQLLKLDVWWGVKCA